MKILLKIFKIKPFSFYHFFKIVRQWCSICILNTVNHKFNIIENSSDLVNLYPKLIKAYNKLFLSELCSISYLVGMECPGLHSIEGALSISMKREYHNNITPKFSVSFTDKRFNYIVIKVESFSFFANVEVIYRI